MADTTDSKLVPYADLQYYPQFDENDTNILFVEGIDLNTMEKQDLESRSFGDKRIQHIHVKGSFAEAILKGALSTQKKQAEEEDA